MKRKLAIVLSCVVCTAAVCQADQISVGSLLIEASSTDGAATFSAATMSEQINGDISRWYLAEPVELRDPDNKALIATLESADVQFVPNSGVSLVFTTQSAGSPTIFTITAPNMNFPTIGSPIARASSAITITDTSGAGTSLSGAYSGGKAYKSFFNDLGMVPATGSEHAVLLDSVSAAPFSSATSSESYPVTPGAFSATDQSGAALPAISNISAQFSFTAGADSLISGTSTFVVVPEPASLLVCLFGTATLMITRRR